MPTDPTTDLLISFEGLADSIVQALSLLNYYLGEETNPVSIDLEAVATGLNAASTAINSALQQASVPPPGSTPPPPQ